MARVTLKLTKPIDPTAPPKAMTTRAWQARRGKKLPKAPPAPAVQAPVSGSPSPATAPGPSTSMGSRRAESSKAGARRADPKAAGSSRRRGGAGSVPATGSTGRATPVATRATKPARRSPAKPASGGKSALPIGEGRPASPRTKRASPVTSSSPLPRRALPTPLPAQAPREIPDHPRLSKRMSELGLCSRREADEWIENGWVKVDGRVVTTLGVRVPPHARIDIDPAASQHQSEQVTILLNKPIGYVSGQAEDGHEPAMVLIKPENRWAGDTSPIRFRPGHLRGLAPAGRLDIDSTGLMVFTQDGRVARHLIGRDSAVEKEYLVRVEGTLTDEGFRLLQHGLELDGVKLKPARVSWQNEHQLRFVLREGRKRQIRRMCELVGLGVTGLKRVRSGGVPLGPLPVGQWRYLRRDEKF